MPSAHLLGERTRERRRRGAGAPDVELPARHECDVDAHRCDVIAVGGGGTNVVASRYYRDASATTASSSAVTTSFTSAIVSTAAVAHPTGNGRRPRNASTTSGTITA